MIRGSLNFLDATGKNKADTALANLRPLTEYYFRRRWAKMMAVAAQTAFAATLVGEPSGKTPAWNDLEPELGEVLCDREVVADGPSRLL